MPKKRYDQIIFEEPLIDIDMQPTEEVDPLFIDPTAESVNNDIEDDLTLNGFSIFSPKIDRPIKQKQQNITPKEIDGVMIKEEVEERDVVKIKEEPKDFEEEKEEDPVDVLAQALDKVEFLCPKCTFRSTDKEQVTQHFVSSHRVFQIGIPRPCDKCDFIAKTVRELAAHKKATHPRTAIVDNLPTLPTGEFKCPHCDFTSFHRNNVRSHTRVHTQDIVYTCDKCPYTAISRMNIENHAARHLIKRRRKWKFKCKHCGLLERTEKLLQRHLILHGEGEMLKCQLCPYKSPYNHIISMHTRICHGIVGKKSWDREEKWQRKIRQSTRTCARERKSYAEDKNDALEEPETKKEEPVPPVQKSRRGRKKRICVTGETKPEAGGEIIESKTEDKEKNEEKLEEISEPPQSDKTEKPEIPRRPTLEERLGRARELINKNIPKKKDKNTEKGEVRAKLESSSVKNPGKSTDFGDRTGDEENPSGSNDSSDSDKGSFEEEEMESKVDDWSENESEFDPATAEESSQSFTSDRIIIDSVNNSCKDNDNSLTDSESLNRVESSGNIEDNKFSNEESGVDSLSDISKTIKRTRGPQRKISGEKSVLETNDLDGIENKRIKLNSPKQSPELNLNNENKCGESVTPDSNKTSKEQSNSTINISSNNINEEVISSDLDDNEVGSEESSSAPAVLVLKRNGSSFTCFPKNNSDSP